MYKKSSQGWFKHVDFILLDMICLQVSFLMAYMIRHDWSTPYYIELYRNMAIVLMLIAALVDVFFGIFKGILKRGYYAEFVATIKQVVLIMLLASFYLVSVQDAGLYSRIVLYLTGMIHFMLGYLVRCLWKKTLKERCNGESGSSLLIITTQERVEKTLQGLLDNNFKVFHIVGIVIMDREAKGEVYQDIPVVANRDDVIEYVQREWVDEVFVNLPGQGPASDAMDLVRQFTEMGTVVHYKLAKTKESMSNQQFVEKMGSYTVLTTSVNTATAGQLFAKRLLDIIGGLVGCLITAILFVIIAPIIYIQSPGPIFFSQIRVGKNGKKFKMYKFRSMYMDAEERKQELMDQNRVKDGMMFKLDFDPRVIGNKILPDGTTKEGIGAFIRKFSLDEFPQFFNCLCGSMSLVGTRPPTLDEWEKYELHHRLRLATKPGITGLWQVSGRSEITDFEEVVRLDKEYICNWSILEDIKILFKTLKVLMLRKGAM